MDSDEHAFEPQGEGLSPDRIFDRQWAVGVVMRVIRQQAESILGDVATFIVGVESQTQSRSNQASHPAERCAVDANSSVHES
ncbi:MAG: hypothetical protein PHO37_02580 [Kiritimatiellae bacterium]|nr:hypothetical protein [Kiritimatiellia bacterium]